MTVCQCRMGDIVGWRSLKVDFEPPVIAPCAAPNPEKVTNRAVSTFLGASTTAPGRPVARHESGRHGSHLRTKSFFVQHRASHGSG